MTERGDTDFTLIIKYLRDVVMISNEQNMLIELQHIQLELRNKRARNLRHFIDQYYCYKNNYVTKSGNPKWDDILWNGYVSVNASKMSSRKDVVKEHVIPLKVITKFLLDQAKKRDLDTDEISRIIDGMLIFATITKDEDKKLSEIGLKSEMPDGYFESDSIHFKDVFSRYKEAKIDLIHKA